MLPDDETLSRTDRAGPFDELTFLYGQNLRSDYPRGARPTNDGNCQDDRGEAGRKDDDEYQDEREPRYHEEEIGHPREDQVRNAAVEAAKDAHGGPEDHRDDRCAEPDDQRDLSAIKEKSQEIEAFPVGSEPMSA